MTGDLQLKGNILMAMGRHDDARKVFEQALKMTSDSNLSQGVKDNAARFNHLLHPSQNRVNLVTESAV
jgi:predicted RNA polymerase sigma factor